ncbi:hypothetical protein Xmau_04493 [Xenorhabdus mauleonii]|uniref:S-type Pyocin n=2 Tax=Xenorhabdus mauleonii TaxID=351675 RepID=A0A1I3YD86_9GAMM|nr:hypothetical protein Xmau_04493 [Xenorhabdus mauleonii]SFK29703.1 S-type Pyocin [Xenorhabdus mauleonii]
MEDVKVRHVKHNESLNRYEFWEDEATSPTLVWYLNAASGEFSQQDIHQYVPQNSTANAKVAVLDPNITGQTPGLPIPEEKDWRDGACINPQQDPNEIRGNSTSTPIPDGRDNGPTKLTTPAPQEKDFRDYILIFPISNIPAIYVYLSKNANDLNAELIDTQEKINSVLREHLPEILKIDPNAEVGYRGSAASEISKAHDLSIARPVNLKSFDVDAFIKSDYLGSDIRYTNRRRDGNKFPEIAKIEQEIDKKLRATLPGLRDEAFGFRIYKSHELDDYLRKGDNQIIIKDK